MINKSDKSDGSDGKELVLEPGLSSELADVAGRSAGDGQPSFVLRFSTFLIPANC